MTPAVSVVLPCLDAEATLAEALESLFAQSFEDFEILAVDDGSRDGTAGVLEGAARRDRRLRFVRQEHGGIVRALVRGIAESRGSLLARMDADDRCHPERLRLQVEHLRERPHVAVVGSRVRLFPRESLKEGTLRYEAWVNGVVQHDHLVRELFVESPLPHPSVCLRRAALEAVGGYRDNGWPEDYDLWMRLVTAGHHLEKRPEVLLDWRDAPGRASRRLPQYDRERFADVKEHSLFARLLRGQENRPLALWGAGPQGKRWARRLVRRGRPPSFFIELDPRKLGKRIHGALVVSPDELERLEGCFVLVAVGALSRARGGRAPYLAAREEIREQLSARGLVELRDFVCLA